MMNYIKSDFKRIKSDFTLLKLIKTYYSTLGFRAVCLFRFSNFLYNRGLKFIAILIKNYAFKRLSCEIGEGAKIGFGLKIGHPSGIVISSLAELGNNVTIQSGVVLGSKSEKVPGAPKIGSNVYIEAGAKILGNIKIGDNCIIGANSVVTKDVPNNSTVVGIPAKSIKIKGDVT